VRSTDRGRRLGGAATLLAVGAPLALLCYGPRLFGLPMQIPSRPSGPLLVELPERYDVRARHGLRLSISTSRMAGQFRPEMGHGRGQPGAGPPEALTRLRLR